MQEAHQGTLPAFFTDMLEQSYSAADVERIIAGCDVRRVTTLRANALKATRDEVAAALDDAGINYFGLPWYHDAFVLQDACGHDLRELPIYTQGKIYVQSLSSMLPPLALGAQPGIDILDMCAAPGGKTTQLAAMGGKGCHITACEMHAPRAEKLEHNLQVQGAGNVMVMRTDARQLDDFFRFDRILLDAPCSGSGTLRVSDPKMPTRFTQKLVQKCCKQQAALLDKALTLLKPGGILVYSTCSVLSCENEDAVTAALKRSASRKGQTSVFEIVPIALAGGDVIPTLHTSLAGSICVCPTSLYEGFFMAKIKRVR